MKLHKIERTKSKKKMFVVEGNVHAQVNTYNTTKPKPKPRAQTSETIYSSKFEETL